MNNNSIKDIGEFGLIRRITRGCLIRSKGVVKGIGDDAAAFTVPSGEVSLMTTDMLVERVHFIRNATTAFNLGHKALAVNLSDIAAMGGTARDAFVSIGIPDDCTVEFVEEMYTGMKKLAAEFDVNIIGGDTTGSKIDLVITIAVTGIAPKKEVMYRDKAKIGDIIFATGLIGDSRAGLHLLLNDIAADTEALKALRKTHLLPVPFLKEGRFLAKQKGIHAAIDVSDGLSSDLGHIVKQSNTGAILEYNRIPVSDNLNEFCGQFGFDPVEYAVEGGEDYILICTVSPETADKVAENYETEFTVPLYPIGEITDTGKIELIFPDSRRVNVADTGWDHFNPNVA